MGIADLQLRVVQRAFKKIANANAAWTPENGGQQQSAQVVFEDNGAAAQFDGFGANGSNISITYQATDFVGLGVSESVSVNGVSYRVRSEPLEINGGMLMQTWLGRF